jgi:hypothetical protein
MAIPIVQTRERRRHLFVGKLAREATATALRKVLEPFAHVASATVMRAEFGGEARGFGCVDMPVSAAAQSALT